MSDGEYGPVDWVVTVSRRINPKAAPGYALGSRSVLHRENCPAISRIDPARTTALDLAGVFRRINAPEQHEPPIHYCQRCNTVQIDKYASVYWQAGLTPTESAWQYLTGHIDDDTLAHLAALRGHRARRLRMEIA